MSIYLHPYSATLWVISTLLMYALAWIVWFRPGQRRHDLFAFYCTYSALVSTALITCSAMNDGVAYTYIYGTTSTSKVSIGIAASTQCAWRVIRKRVKYYGGLWKLGLDLAPYLVCALAILYMFRPTAGTLWISLDWVLILLSGGCLWVISFASDSWKLQWTTREYGVAAGFLWLCSLRFIVVGLRIVIPPSETPSLYGLDICITIVAILVWLKYFLKKEPELLNLSLQQLTEIKGLLVSCEKSVATNKSLTAGQSRS